MVSTIDTFSRYYYWTMYYRGLRLRIRRGLVINVHALHRFLLLSLFLCFVLTLLYNFPGLQDTTNPLRNTITLLLYRAIFYGKILGQIIRPTSQCRLETQFQLQNVVAFSLFFRKNEAEVLQNYVPGIKSNLEKIRVHYPGWVMRIYTNLAKDAGYFQYFRNETDLHICNVTNLPGIGDVTNIHEMVWRFLPIGDPTVHTFIVRDLDSIISRREQSAVSQWLDSNKTFHTMRDSPFHKARVMGGLWGAKNYLMTRTMRLKLRNLFIQYGYEILQKDKNDQDLLETLLYKPYRHLFISHDSYRCRFHPDSVPFPEKRPRPMEFVGMKSFEYGVHDPFPCEPECRPSYGQDWHYC